MPKIGKRSVDALIAAGVPGVIRDSELPGFQARLNADGSVTFSFEYRSGAGGRTAPKRRFKIGLFGEPRPGEKRPDDKHAADITLTPDLARKEALRIAGAVKGGDDPAGRLSAKRREQTVASWLEHCLETHWRPKRKASTAKAFSEMIQRSLVPAFGTTKLSDLSRAQVRAWHAKQTHRPRQGNLDIAILSRAMSLAVADDLVPANPVLGIMRHPEKARDRAPSDAEMARLWRSFGQASIRPSSRLLFRLLTLTGCRRDEIRTAKWSYVDFRARLLRLPDAKAGARDVPLPSVAMELLAAEERRGDWIIANDAGDAPLSPSRVHADWVIACTAAEVKDMRTHDLRHGYGTRAAGTGANALVLRDALGHRTLTMTGRYVAKQHDPVRALSDKLAAEITALGEREEPAEIVPLEKRRRRR